MIAWRGLDGRLLFALSLAWALAIIFVDPRGSVPLIDDWSYRSAIVSLLDQGRFTLPDWSAANLVGHVAWGWLFAALFGHDHVVLRSSTLVLGFAGGAALYVWLRRLDVRPSMAFLAAATLLFNPIYLALSFTFMTDVPYAAVQTVALLLIATAMTSSRPGIMAVGWLAGVFALAYRQVGFAIPIGFAAARLRHVPGVWQALPRALLPLLLFILLQRGYELVLATNGLIPIQFGFNAEEIRHQLAGPFGKTVVHAALGLAYALLYLGLFAWPLVIAAYGGLAGGLGRSRAIAVHSAVLVFSVITIGLVVFAFGAVMPIWNDGLGRWGVGPDHYQPVPPPGFALTLTVLSVAGGSMGLAVLILRLVQIWKSDHRDRIAVHLTLAFAVGVTLYSPILITPSRFDRYLLPILPCLFVVLLAIPGRAAAGAFSAVRLRGALLWVAVVPFLGLGLYGLAATRDYLATSRARQAGLDFALALGHPRETIDAGWVLNGRDLYGRVGRMRTTTSVGSWHGDPVVCVDVRPRFGYDVVAAIPVHRIMPWFELGEAPMLVQRRMPGYGAFIGPPTYDSYVGPEFGYPHE